MSYLAISAAPYDNNYENTSIEQKKMSRNSTQNNTDLLINNEKVNQVLQSISNLHKNPQLPEDNDNDLADFTPPPPPVSAGVNRTINKESVKPTPMQQQQTQNPKPSYSSSFEQNESELNNYTTNYGNEQTVNEYYKKYIPNYSPQQQQQQQAIYPYRQEPSKEDLLLEKLNYMIYLLEEQKDEKTGTVMEEVVLYSFLGIFIIYIVDSFTRIGKYTR
jgi:hypothetical protein